MILEKVRERTISYIDNGEQFHFEYGRKLELWGYSHKRRMYRAVYTTSNSKCCQYTTKRKSSCNFERITRYARCLNDWSDIEVAMIGFSIPYRFKSWRLDLKKIEWNLSSRMRHELERGIGNLHQDLKHGARLNCWEEIECAHRCRRYYDYDNALAPDATAACSIKENKYKDARDFEGDSSNFF